MQAARHHGRVAISEDQAFRSQTILIRCRTAGFPAQPSALARCWSEKINTLLGLSATAGLALQRVLLPVVDVHP